MPSLRLHLEVAGVPGEGEGEEAVGLVLASFTPRDCGRATNQSIRHSTSLNRFIHHFPGPKGGRKLRRRAAGSQREREARQALARAPGRAAAAETTVPGLLREAGSEAKRGAGTSGLRAKPKSVKRAKEERRSAVPAAAWRASFTASSAGAKRPGQRLGSAEPGGPGTQWACFCRGAGGGWQMASTQLRASRRGVIGRSGGGGF